MDICCEIPRAAREKNKVAFFKNISTECRELVGAHYHDCYEILYIRRGSGEQLIHRDTWQLCPGDVVIIQPGECHATKAISETGCDVDIVQFFASFFSEDAVYLNTLSSGVLHPTDEAFPFVFDRLSALNACEDPGYRLILEGLIRLLCGLCVQSCAQSYPLRLSGSMARICDYLEQADDLRLQSVARQWNYSPEHLSRKFKKELGVSYKAWCNKLRMRRAAQMLSTGAESAAEIAAAIGYKEEGSFIRAFKKAYGVTPGHYKRHLIRFGE